ncbi:MAG: hypothetical protein IKO51_02610 [Clostridia bacterium]|nr:hypothetical protein [Clostridia bacterium]
MNTRPGVIEGGIYRFYISHEDDRQIVLGGIRMSITEDALAAEWLNRLKELNVHVKKMFGCYCLYCDGQPVGWIHDAVLSLREVGLDYLPEGIKRPAPEDKIKELVIPFDYINAEWLPKAVQDTADIRKRSR